MTLQVVDSSGNGYQLPRTHREVEATLIAENTFTDALIVSGKTQRLSVSVSGISGDTVTLQRRLDDSNWRDVKDYTSDADETYLTDEQGDIRIGIKSSNYSTGTVVCRLGLGV